MRIIKQDLPRQYSRFEIHTFADLHLGDKFADLDLIYSTRQHIQDTPHAYVIVNGDVMNNATKTSVSDSYAEELTPMEQIDTAVKLLEPIKDKILCINSGNHEKRTYNKEGIDLMEIVARELKIDDRFSKGGSFIFLRCGERSKHYDNRQMMYTFYVNHGSGGGRKEGAKAIRLADMASIVDADIYIHSHTHLPMVMKQSFFRSDPSNQSVKVVDKLFVNTAAALNYGGYGEEYEFKPSSTATPIIYISGKKREMKAIL